MSDQDIIEPVWREYSLIEILGGKITDKFFGDEGNIMIVFIPQMNANRFALSRLIGRDTTYIDVELKWKTPFLRGSTYRLVDHADVEMSRGHIQDGSRSIKFRNLIAGREFKLWIWGP